MKQTYIPVSDAIGSLAHSGAASIAAAAIRERLPQEARTDAVLAACWSDLEPDRYLPGNVAYRWRRYGRLHARPRADETYDFTALPHSAFSQPSAIIPLYGGRPREFAPIASETLLSEALLAVVLLDLDMLMMAGGMTQSYVLGVHMIRIVATTGVPVFPTPEGRHRDGHSYVAMHLIARENCIGGKTRVYHPGRSDPVLETTLFEPLDTLLVDDWRVEHEVTPVLALGSSGFRDMLLVDFDLASAEGWDSFERKPL